MPSVKALYRKVNKIFRENLVMHSLLDFIGLVLRRCPRSNVVGPTIRLIPFSIIERYQVIRAVVPILVDATDVEGIQRIGRINGAGGWIDDRSCRVHDEGGDSIYSCVGKSPVPESEIIWAFIEPSIRRFLRETESRGCVFPLLRLGGVITSTCECLCNAGCFSADGLLFPYR